MAPTLEEHLFAPGVKRVLALDGGGVKGIVSIAFLEKMETLLRERSGRGNDFRLCDYFDLVGGTSTGSLLATLIALGYPVADIKKMYLEWAPAIFRAPWFGFSLLGPRFSSRGLKKRARAVLKDRTLETADLKTGFAIIAKRVDTGSPWVLSNNPRSAYWNDPDDRHFLGNRNYRLADLVCASAAAPSYFAPKRLRMVHQDRRGKHNQGQAWRLHRRRRVALQQPGPDAADAGEHQGLRLPVVSRRRQSAARFRRHGQLPDAVEAGILDAQDFQAVCRARPAGHDQRRRCAHPYAVAMAVRPKTPVGDQFRTQGYDRRTPELSRSKRCGQPAHFIRPL